MEPLYKPGMNGKRKVCLITREDKDILIKTGYEGGVFLTQRVLYRSDKELKLLFDKKIKQGYLPEQNENPSKHKGIRPMLSHVYKDYAEYIRFPCYVQPKLDGVRALYYNDTLYTRNEHEIKEMNHIKDELKYLNFDGVLDGELYCHEYTFPELMEFINKKHYSNLDYSRALKIEYVVFDYISKDPYDKRLDTLRAFFKNSKYIKVIQNTEIGDSTKIKDMLTVYESAAYEGIMIKNKTGAYTRNSRSKNSLKLKSFYDAEFKVTGFQEGTGIEKGAVIWVCQTKTGETFTVRPKGSYEDRVKLFTKAREYIGKMLTVRYQELFDNIPRFPVGIGVPGLRDIE
jgi:ATP-dependent DNA ligase